MGPKEKHTSALGIPGSLKKYTQQSLDPNMNFAHGRSRPAGDKGRNGIHSSELKTGPRTLSVLQKTLPATLSCECLPNHLADLLVNWDASIEIWEQEPLVFGVPELTQSIQHCDLFPSTMPLVAGQAAGQGHLRQMDHSTATDLHEKQR